MSGNSWIGKHKELALLAGIGATIATGGLAAPVLAPELAGAAGAGIAGATEGGAALGSAIGGSTAADMLGGTIAALPQGSGALAALGSAAPSMTPAFTSGLANALPTAASSFGPSTMAYMGQTLGEASPGLLAQPLSMPTLGDALKDVTPSWGARAQGWLNTRTPNDWLGMANQAKGQVDSQQQMRMPQHERPQPGNTQGSADALARLLALYQPQQMTDEQRRRYMLQGLA